MFELLPGREGLREGLREVEALCVPRESARRRLVAALSERGDRSRVGDESRTLMAGVGDAVDGEVVGERVGMREAVLTFSVFVGSRDEVWTRFTFPLFVTSGDARLVDDVWRRGMALGPARRLGLATDGMMDPSSDRVRDNACCPVDEGNPRSRSLRGVPAPFDVVGLAIISGASSSENDGVGRSSAACGDSFADALPAEADNDRALLLSLRRLEG